MSISPGFIVISEIKPVKDESTGGAAPIRSVLQPWITRIPGAENVRSNDGGLPEGNLPV